MYLSDSGSEWGVTMRKATVFLAMALLPVSAGAQTVAHSFAELNRQEVLKEGDKILIAYADESAGRETEGELVNLADSAITV